MVDLRIIFMGTPEFAVSSLRALVENDWPVVAVITAPDRKKGRGQIIVPSPVKEYAVSKNIPVLQPTNLKSPEFIEELKSYQANLQVVVAFRMLPEVVWEMPALGTFNLHASLLPNYRGAAPINWAIINGEKETGVTTFFLKQEIDTGEIILQEKEPITERDTVGSLYSRLMVKGGRLILKTVEQIANESVITHPQVLSGDNKPAPKIFKDTCEINWKLPFEKINNFVRGLNPYPAAWTTIDGKTCKIFNIVKAVVSYPKEEDLIITDHKSKIYMRCADGWAEIMELQIEGKKRMQTSDLLRGNPLTNIASIE
jgi:methionyl-tRNA formyltransferase